MENQDVFSKDKTYVAHIYNRFPVAVQSGHGATARDCRHWPIPLW